MSRSGPSRNVLKGWRGSQKVPPQGKPPGGAAQTRTCRHALLLCGLCSSGGTMTDAMAQKLDQATASSEEGKDNPSARLLFQRARRRFGGLGQLRGVFTCQKVGSRHCHQPPLRCHFPRRQVAACCGRDFRGNSRRPNKLLWRCKTRICSAFRR